MHSTRFLPLVAFVLACNLGAAPLGRAEEGVIEDFISLFHKKPYKHPLADYQGTNRVLLVFAPSAEDPVYRSQLEMWRKERQNFEERQLVIRPVIQGQPSAKELGKLYNVGKNDFAVVLIGKDGSEAYRAANPVSGNSLYNHIDAMPMRREEIKRQQRRSRE